MKNNISNKFYEALKEKKVLIASHRGVFGGSIIENTTGAFLLAFECGADIVEFDICVSKDNKYYVYHDNEELRTLGFYNNLRRFESKEIDSMFYLNRYGFKTSQKIEKLEDVLTSLKGKGFLNIDRAFLGSTGNMSRVLDIALSYDMLNQIIIKSPVKDAYLQEISEYKYPVMFMPIVSSIQDVAALQKYQLNVVALELLFESEKSPLIDSKQMEIWNKLNYALWVNTICIDEKYIMSAGLHDNHALLINKDEAWGNLIDKGFNIIQTDWPYLVHDYREKKVRR